jgi:hypothetical protein
MEESPSENDRGDEPMQCDGADKVRAKMVVVASGLAAKLESSGYFTLLTSEWAG